MEKENGLLTYLKNISSFDEKKASTIVLLCIAFSILTFYLTFKNGDIPVNCMQFLIFLVSSITGLNLPSVYINAKSNAEIKKMQVSQEMASDGKPVVGSQVLTPNPQTIDKVATESSSKSSSY